MKIKKVFCLIGLVVSVTFSVGTGYAKEEIAGNYGKVKVKFSQKREISIENNQIEIGTSKRARGVGHINKLKYKQGSIENLIPDLYFWVGEEGAKSTYEYHNTVKVKDISIEERANSIACIIEQSWPRVEIKKTVEFFDDKPYIHLRYELKVTKDFKSKGVAVHLMISKKMDSSYYPESDKVISRAHSLANKQKWSGFSFSAKERWLAFQNQESKEGFAIIGADAKNWSEYSGRISGGESPKGGYSLMFKKWDNQELRKGNKVSFDFFLFVFKGDAVEKTKEIFNLLCPDDTYI